MRPTCIHCAARGQRTGRITDCVPLVLGGERTLPGWSRATRVRSHRLSPLLKMRSTRHLWAVGGKLAEPSQKARN